MKVRQTVVMFRISSKDITILSDTVFFRFTDAETEEEHEVSEPKSKVDIWRDTRFSDEYIVCIWKWIFCKSSTLMRYANRIGEFFLEHDFTREDIMNELSIMARERNDESTESSLKWQYIKNVLISRPKH